jgi:hypothetical protein
MSVSSDGILTYGYALEEDAYVPWNDEKYNNDFDVWWMQVNGYKPPHDLYDENGGYRPEITMKEKNENREYRKQFHDDHPQPIQLVQHCSYEYPMYIIAAKETTTLASRGYPRMIELELLTLASNGQADILKEFCDEYDIEVKGEPAWWLASMYG